LLATATFDPETERELAAAVSEATQPHPNSRKANPASQANLVPFKPGENGSPRGPDKVPRNIKPISRMLMIAFFRRDGEAVQDLIDRFAKMPKALLDLV
jgi:hypothetical protein